MEARTYRQPDPSWKWVDQNFLNLLQGHGGSRSGKVSKRGQHSHHPECNFQLGLPHLHPRRPGHRTAKLLHTGGQRFRSCKGGLWANLRHAHRFPPHGLQELEPGSHAQRLSQNNVSRAVQSGNLDPRQHTIKHQAVAKLSTSN